MAAKPQVTSRTVRQYTVIDVPDTLVDRDDLDVICSEIMAQVDKVKPPRLVLNFKQVTHMSSSFLGRLLAMQKKIVAKNGKLILADMDEHIFDVFVVTRLNKQIPVFRTMKQAISPLPPWWVMAAAAGAIVVLALVGWLLMK
jgi:anti-anti-sigma factor